MFQLDVLDTIVGQEGDEVDSDSEDEDGDEDEDGGISDLSSDVDSVDEDGRKKEEEPRNVKHIQDMVSKLDNILEMVFKHLDRLRTNAVSSPNSRSPSPTALPLSSPTADDTDLAMTSNYKHALSEKSHSRLEEEKQSLTESHFNALLAIFKRTILRTFKSRYTQFLLFWYSSLDDTFRDCFLGALVSAALLEPSQPVVTRAAAASYLASYVSRAAFVGREETQSVVRVLCDFLAAHLRRYDELAQGSGTLMQQQQSTEHAVFYAVAQAMFLIFCFRWRDLKEDCDEPDEYGDVMAAATLAHKAWYPPVMVMKRVVNSPLNPLKVNQHLII